MIVSGAQLKRIRVCPQGFNRHEKFERVFFFLNYLQGYEETDHLLYKDLIFLMWTQKFLLSALID